MKFESISIKNFRNFEDTKITLSNKNIFFGLNDVGKTNFLYALRYLFDKDIRKRNLLDSDYFNRETNIPIEIVITIDIQDNSSSDTQKLRAKLKGALLSSHKKAYIKLIAEYDTKEMLGLPILYWGGDINKLSEMKQRGYLYDIDYVVNVFYIDSYIDLNSLFKRNVNQLIKNDSEDDQIVLDHIESTVESLNNQIASLSGIKDFEEKITPEYKKYKNEGVSISVKSEIGIKGLYSNIVPYIRQDDDNNLYPTAGEGRKKLLSYSIYDLISEESAEERINIFLVEEPETHLHKAMQIALSQILFNDDKYHYLFVTTHSPYVLYDMDKVNLVRIFNKTKISSESTFYKVPMSFHKNRKALNRFLAEAIFADKVLLVEGESELLLFERVLSTVSPFYEADGVYILWVGGIGFDPYFSLLDKLGIHNVIKTDNDLRSTKKGYSVLGFSRCNEIIGEEILPTERIESDTVDCKRALYENNQEILDEIREKYYVHLSRCDLENDLDEVLHNELVSYLGVDDTVAHLQESKRGNMVKLIEKLTNDDCKKIYDHYNFACLKAVIE